MAPPNRLSLSILKVQVFWKDSLFLNTFLKDNENIWEKKNLEKLLVKGSSFVTCFGEFLWELFEFDNTKSDLIISEVLIWMTFESALNRSKRCALFATRDRTLQVHHRE